MVVIPRTSEKLVWLRVQETDYNCFTKKDRMTRGHVLLPVI
jgi:hypothetical protein